MKENPQPPLLPNAFALFNGIQISSPGPDHGEAILHIGPNSLNPYGLLHGGAYYTMADCAGGCACRTDGSYYAARLLETDTGYALTAFYGPYPAPGTVED